MPTLKKLDGGGIAADERGFPIMVDDDGKEYGMDVISMRSQITNLNGEARSHRVRAEAAEQKLAAFSGIEDPAAAVQAIQTVKNLKDKQVLEAGEVQKIKDEAVAGVKASYETATGELKKQLDTTQAQIRDLVVVSAFGLSPFVREKLIYTPADAAKIFGDHFKVEVHDGRPVAVAYNGEKPIYSRSRPGEIAAFDEALEIIVESRQDKESILRAQGGQGGGAGHRRPGQGGGTDNRTSTEKIAAGISKLHK